LEEEKEASVGNVRVVRKIKSQEPNEGDCRNYKKSNDEVTEFE
jgi:hypothetical protein